MRGQAVVAVVQAEERQLLTRTVPEKVAKPTCDNQLAPLVVLREALIVHGQHERHVPAKNKSGWACEQRQ